MDFEEFKERYQKVPVEEYPNRVVETMSEPMVSVHVSTYQHADFIHDCMEGVLMQETDFPVEIIIGEDDSDDGTREICKEYAEQYPELIRLFLHRRENNIAIQGRPTGRFQFVYSHFMARGKYIAICEGDDYWTNPKKLQKQGDLLEARSDLAFCFTASAFSYEDEGRDDKIVRPKGSNPIYHLRDIILKNFIVTCTVMYRGYIFDKIPDYFRETPVGDWPLFVILAQQGDIGYIDDVTAVRRVHQSGVWSKMSFRKQLKSWIRTRELIYDSLSVKHKSICNDFLLSKKKKLIYHLSETGSYDEVCSISRDCLNHMYKSKQNKYNIGGYIKYSLCTVKTGAKISHKIGKYWRRISRGIKRRLGLLE